MKRTITAVLAAAFAILGSAGAANAAGPESQITTTSHTGCTQRVRHPPGQTRMLCQAVHRAGPHNTSPRCQIGGLQCSHTFGSGQAPDSRRDQPSEMLAPVSAS